MTDPFTKQFAEMFKTTGLPEPMQAMVEEGLSRTRDTALKSIEVARGGAEALSKANPLASKEAGALAKKAFDQVVENTEAAFAVAQSLTRAKSPVEAAELQASYEQTQLAKSGAQGKELFELSTKLARQTVEATASLATKAAKA